MAHPSVTYTTLFLRFLRFGLLAWGGPVAQIAMLKQELVEQEKWITPERFNRVLAVYQVLPGPEAAELCVYFGMLKRGRLGGVLAGLGFMLPGFVLMFVLSWIYLTFGLGSALFASLFFGVQPAVAALIIRAVHRIGEHTLMNRFAWAVAALSFIGSLYDVPFWLTLGLGGLAYALVRVHKYLQAGIVVCVLIAGSIALCPPDSATPSSLSVKQEAASPLDILGSGLKAGLLTFGGAYTAIPFLRTDAVENGKWMTDAQFLDGLALSGILPAPLIIFSTFVGYVAGGTLGALLITIGIFLPAFLFTLLGHSLLERVIENPKIHGLLEGITAGVVGLIAATALELFPLAVRSSSGALIFAVALATLYLSKAKTAVVWVIACSAAAGFVLF